MSKTELIQSMRSSWSELEAFLASLTEDQMTGIQDAQSWTVKDHLAHLAAWEQSVLLLFDGQPRRVTLGVPLERWKGEYVDENNALFREHWQSKSLPAVIAELRQIHQALLAKVETLTDADLERTTAELFPHDEPVRQRKVLDLLHGNTDLHYREHLPWMQEILK